MATADEEKLQPMERRTGDLTAAADEPEIKYSGWKAMPYIVGNEIFEKLGALGTISNLVVYLTTVFHMRSVASAVLINVFNGTSNVAPLLGAFLADSCFGRYATVAVASIASQLGMLIIMLTAAVSKLHPPSCEQGQQCSGPTAGQLAVFISGLCFIIIGAGGIRPCNLAFGADQFDPQTESGRKGINSFFNLYYFTFNIALIISATFIIYVQSNVSWSIGFGIPAILMFFSCAFFFLGSKIYVKVRPEGSPFSSVAQVLVAAFRKRRLNLPDEPNDSMYDPPHFSSLITRLEHTNQFRILDKAALITREDVIGPAGLSSNPWRLCSLQQVEQLKCLVRILPIWSTGILYQVASSLQTTYVIFQAMQSDRHLGNSNFSIPAGSFIVFPMLAMATWLPIYDRIIVPWLQKVTKGGGIKLLHRMGIGLVLCIVSMILSGFIEDVRRSYTHKHPPLGFTLNGGTISSFSSLWLIPQLSIMGLSEAFNIIGQVEFYYKQFPENMRSVGGSLLYLGFACANYLGSFMITIVHKRTGRNGSPNWLAEDLSKGRLDLFYFIIAFISLLNFIYFIIIRVIPIWASGWLYYIAIAQQQTYVVLQALQSDRRIGNSKFEIPAASFTIFPMIALTVWIPVYDGIVVPLLRKVNKKEEGMTLLQKMGIGMILSIAAMLISGAIEVRRRNYARYYPMIGTAQGGGGISSMSSFWLVPQLSLLGFSEAFNLVSQLEFYYRQFPENMRSVAGSLLFCGIAISSYMSGFLVTVVNGVTSRGGRNSWLAEDLNKGKLDYYYYLIAVMGAVNLVYFLVWSKWYKYKGFVAAADHLERDRHKEEEA